MKKNFKTLTAFLLLFALITIIKPIQPSVDSNNEPGISVCGDDDKAAIEAITAE